MKPLFKAVLGANLGSLRQLIHGPVLWARVCARSFRTAARPIDPSVEAIPDTLLTEILGERAPKVSLIVSKYQNGMLPFDQVLALLAIAVAEQPKVVVEIGTFMGYTSLQLVENLPDALIHTVDLPPDIDLAALANSIIPKDDFHLIRERRVGFAFLDSPQAARIRQHYADTATWDFEPAKGADFFFIDGSHTYEYCKNDSEKCLEASKPGAVFIWHDCDPSHPGVAKCLVEWRALGRNICRIAGTPLAYWKRPL
jgi:predicted O-methyltransferase YrrM